MKTLREKIEQTIVAAYSTVNVNNPEHAAFCVCNLLDAEIELRGRGWLTDPNMQSKVAEVIGAAFDGAGDGSGLAGSMPNEQAAIAVCRLLEKETGLGVDGWFADDDELLDILELEAA
ncbi:hypothetical protein [Rhizobium sp. LCM 4573]|uniref:hypothetical protein n=1 Tax=Rhizobium sp. LCM 4573 TaxID=1848291 RepID=UPI0008DA499E|nr:hypothetical protein [Rhizobium sp. LCM 4573]OHV78533.1 hypothetical protein LCM4573_26515 [Rhizobium sp. LCM 4573]